MKAAAHPKQSERLAALRSFDILDTPREAEFDDVVHLAARICGTPISVINLIDRDRQWFKAEVGLGTRETPLDTSICSHIILSDDFVQIADTHADPRTADNELCTPQDGLRFYAGALLKTENGLPIGTLCVLDNQPRELDDLQRFALQVLARRVMRELELRRALRKQDMLRSEMDHRVKNSLASVASTVRLYRREAARMDDPDAAFDAIQRQLDAVAAVHRGIYCNAGSEVDLADYLSQLAGNLDATLPMSARVVVNAPEDVCISPELATTLGLVVNEFVANTIKHGEMVESVSVEVAARRAGDDLILECINDAPERVSPKGDTAVPQGIGSRLMSAAVAQHGGTLDAAATKGGYRVTATVPLPL